MIETIPADWRAALADAIEAPSFRRLADELAAERPRTDSAIYPPEPLVFNALRLTRLDSVRAVILGQDPYHGEGQADSHSKYPCPSDEASAGNPRRDNEAHTPATDAPRRTS